VAVPSLSALKTTPRGSLPFSLILGAGIPVAVVVKLKAFRNVAV
jgi:hypothetical protein